MVSGFRTSCGQTLRISSKAFRPGPVTKGTFDIKIRTAIKVITNKATRKNTGLSRTTPITTFNSPSASKISNGLTTDQAAALRSAAVGRNPCEANRASTGAA